MRGIRLLVGTIALLTGCTRANPESCLDGTCTDPRFPFCDVEGVVDGLPGACIAVDCEPLTFQVCNGAQAITCNPTGNDYDLVTCPLGCDAASGGCRRCEPNQTACTNGEVATCDANGTVVSSTPCPLGCFEDEPRCREIDPSNGLAQFLDMVDDPPNVAMTDGHISTDTGEMGSPTGGIINVPSFLVVMPGPVPDLRVFVVNSLVLDGTTLVVGDSEFRDVPSPALAIVARGEVAIRGAVRVHSTAGELSGSDCTAGSVYSASRSGSYLYVASGGGGNATAGGAGGGVSTNDFDVSHGGAATSNDDLVPLHGGCSAGGLRDMGRPTQLAGTGGGAIQIASATRIDVNGVIDVRGVQGAPKQGDLARGFFIFGGGAGGSILLEAPFVTLSNGARLIAKGGPGGAIGATNATSTDDAAATPGAICQPPGPRCGDGGAGATAGQGAVDGVTATYATNVTDVTFQGGGGGGGLGRLRINTRDGSYSKTSEVVEAAAVTTGAIGTR